MLSEVKSTTKKQCPSTPRTQRLKQTFIDHIGIVVNDMDKSIAFYESVLGWGPFKVMEVPMEGFIFKGNAGDAILKLAFAYAGDIEIELIQVLKGETPHSEHLRVKGEGLQHVRCCVDDVDAELAELAKDGIEPVFYQEMKGMGKMFAYLNTDKVGGVMLELLNKKLKVKMTD